MTEGMIATTDPAPVVVNRPPVFVKLFHGSGLQVSVPLGVGLDPTEVYADLDHWLSAGWKPEPPGIEPGEHKEDAGYIVRKFLSNDRGDSTRLDIYCVEDKFSKLSIYLDRQEQVDEFEKVTGVRIQDIPIYDGSDKIERGKDRRIDQKYVFKLPRPVAFVWKDNPKYDEKQAAAARERKEIYKVPSRVFVCWGNQSPSPTANAPQAQSQGPQPAVVDQDVIDDWQRFLVTRPMAHDMNEKLKQAAGATTETKRAVFAIASRYAEEQGYDWLHDAKIWVDPRPPQADGDEIPF